VLTLAPSLYIPVVIEYPADLATLDPEIPSKSAGFANWKVPPDAVTAKGAPLNLYVVPFVKPCPGAVTFIIPEPDERVSNAFFGKEYGTAFSVLSLLTFLNAIPSAEIGFGSNCGCFGSNSETCTNDPFHSLTISLYGNSTPDLSDIAFACLPVAYFAIMLLGSKL